MTTPTAIFQEHFPVPTTPGGAIWRYNWSYATPEHFHGQLELLVVLRGHARERIGGQVFAVHAGQLVWHLPTVVHEMLEPSADLDFRVVHLEPEVVSLAVGGQCGASDETALASPFDGWLEQLSRMTAGRPVVELRRRDLDALLEDCDQTYDEGLPARDDAERLARLCRTAWRATEVNHQDLRKLSLVELACCELLGEPWLERRELCRRLGVSESFLSRSFDRHLHTTFVEQRARARLSLFARLAAAPEANFLRAALAAGFGSYSQLHRVFVQHVGESPRAYVHHGGRVRRASITRHDRQF